MWLARDDARRQTGESMKFDPVSSPVANRMAFVPLRMFRSYPRPSSERQRRTLGIQWKLKLEIRCKLTGGPRPETGISITGYLVTVIDISGRTMMRIDKHSISPISMHIHEALNRALCILRHHGGSSMRNRSLQLTKSRPIRSERSRVGVA